MAQYISKKAMIDILNKLPDDTFINIQGSLGHYDVVDIRAHDAKDPPELYDGPWPTYFVCITIADDTTVSEQVPFTRDDIVESLLSQRVEQVGLPLRVSNVLRLNKIYTVREFLARGRERLFGLRGFGKGCQREIDAFVQSKHLQWLDSDT